VSRPSRVGRHDLPEPTRTAAPAGSLLAQEASGVTYDWDTDSLFVVGDGGTSVVQVSKTGALIDSMTLAPGGSPQGTTFYDTEGITYIGNGEFVMTEERDRQLVRFTYAAGTTLTREETKTVKLGTTIGNIGLEGVTNDPTSGGFVVVKEMEPESIFQTDIDWDAGTATNGSPTTIESTNLFEPALAGTADFSDVFALSNLSTLSGPEASHLLIISQESGKIVNVDRSGNVSSSLTIVSDPGNPLSVPEQTDEGVTMDNAGDLYVVNENGGGDSNHPQLWVYEPSTEPNRPVKKALGDRKATPAHAGQRGDTGPRGPSGIPGKDGTFYFSASDTTLSARRGQTVNLPLRLANATTASTPKSTATASAPAERGQQSRTWPLHGEGSAADRRPDGDPRGHGPRDAVARRPKR
jgi:uncharacterized protein YjiK